MERRERGARWFYYRAREAKKDEDIGFKFSMDFIWVGLISILVVFFFFNYYSGWVNFRGWVDFEWIYGIPCNILV